MELSQKQLNTSIKRAADLTNIAEKSIYAGQGATEAVEGDVGVNMKLLIPSFPKSTRRPYLVGKTGSARSMSGRGSGLCHTTSELIDPAYQAPNSSDVGGPALPLEIPPIYGYLGWPGYYGLWPSCGHWCQSQPDALVFDIDGDASFNMALTELSIAAQFNIGVKIIVLNNEEQGMKNPDFMKLVDALKWLIKANGPALLEVVTDKKVLVLPIVPVWTTKDKERRELMKERTKGVHS
ncbi:hypothetical protein MKX08_005083 [Trichoderma sp. CBMAI-0020]|nr:hypothetical protein MKX08_005083 [Trichoderma sp. CBMAI-0020]